MCALFGWLDCGMKLPHKLLKRFTQELARQFGISERRVRQILQKP